MIKMKKIMLITIISVLLIASIILVCYATGVFDKASPSFDKNDPTTWFEYADNGGIEDTLTEQIKVGMSLEEIVDIIGKPQRDIGSGVWLLEWQMKSGKVLVVAFNSTPSEDHNETSVDETLNLVSFAIEIRDS